MKKVPYWPWCHSTFVANMHFLLRNVQKQHFLRTNLGVGAVFPSCLDDNADDDIDAEAGAINAEDIDDNAEADEIDAEDDTRLALVRPVLGDIALVVTLPLIILLPAMHDDDNELICDHCDEDDDDERDHGDEDDDNCAQLRRHLRSLLHDL